MWKKDFEILQNNQDIFHLKNMKRVKESLITSTKLRSKEKNFNVEDDTDDNIFSFEEFLGFKIQDKTLSDNPNMNMLTTLLNKEKGKDKPGCQKQHLVQFPVDENVLFQNEDIDYSLDTSR